MEAEFNNKDEPPSIPGVYEVQITIHGELHPKPHEPKIYAYWDGVDTWSGWRFNRFDALKNSLKLAPTVRLPWRELVKG